MRELVILSGKAGVGKDTSADIIEAMLEPRDVYKSANADPLKRMTVKFLQYFYPNKYANMTLDDLERLKDEEHEYVLRDKNMRDVLYDVSIIEKSEFDDEVWVELFYKNWKKSSKKYGIIPDIRLKEVLFVQELAPEDVRVTHIHVEGISRRKYANIAHGMNKVVLSPITQVVVNDSGKDELRGKLQTIIDSLRNIG